MNTYILRDRCNKYEPSAIIETEMTAEEVQDIIWNHENDPDYEECYDSETLTEVLNEKGIKITWIAGDDEIEW